MMITGLWWTFVEGDALSKLLLITDSQLRVANILVLHRVLMRGLFNETFRDCFSQCNTKLASKQGTSNKAVSSDENV